MNSRSLSLLAWIGCGLLAGGPAQAASTTPALAAPAPAITNAPTQTIPRSVFLLPASPEEGRDPFFPRSMRPYASVMIKTNSPPSAAALAPVSVPVELRLDGISGTPEHRLAIINYRTFEAGEEADVMSGAVRTHVRCLEIKADSVVVQVAGERRILRLRSGL